MAYLFQKILQKGYDEGLKPNSKQSIDWFRQMALNTKSANPSNIINDTEPFKRIVTLKDTSIGKMYMFGYDPKLKAILPYYDKFPLIFPIEWYNDGFLGINLHYLPPIIRAKLMDALYKTINNNKYNKTTKLNLSYNILKSATRFNSFKPCVKRYLFNHVITPFMYVSPDEWDIALMLPTQRFVGASAANVWKQSLEKS